MIDGQCQHWREIQIQIVLLQVYLVAGVVVEKITAACSWSQ
jgi:hypothetical protein